MHVQVGAHICRKTVVASFETPIHVSSFFFFNSPVPIQELCVFQQYLLTLLQYPKIKIMHQCRIEIHACKLQSLTLLSVPVIYLNAGHEETVGNLECGMHQAW